MPFGQTFSASDLAVIALLVLLEGLLSIDNALVLGLLAKRLPPHQRHEALTYGLVGAFAFRAIVVGTAALLMKWRIVKLFGGAYLLWVVIKHFLLDAKTDDFESRDGEDIARIPTRQASGFWATVLVIELTDIAFAIDSILAAIALVGASPAQSSGVHPKLWLVLVGGMLGVILMRFAAVLFIRLLERFPRFELSAYLLVTLIGLKLMLDWTFNSPTAPERLNFHAYRSAPFWVFWLLMISCIGIGFAPAARDSNPAANNHDSPRSRI